MDYFLHGDGSILMYIKLTLIKFVTGLLFLRYKMSY
jgi:hypothetical protein